MKKTRIKQEFVYTGVNLTPDIRHRVHIAAAENDAAIAGMMRHLISLGLEAYIQNPVPLKDAAWGARAEAGTRAGKTA
jgi:hypothetical protein